MNYFQLFTALVFLFMTLSAGAQGIAINDYGSVPDSSAMLDVQSTDKGLLVPRMTSGQRTGIAGPATGLMVYDMTTNSFWCYAGSSWVELMSGYVAILKDEDNDTKIDVEANPDEDVIRFKVAGTERWVIDSIGLAPKNSGGSVFIGSSAGRMDDRMDNFNVFVGDSSGSSNTTGEWNAAFGVSAMNANTTGFFQTASGYQSLYKNTTGHSNTAHGFRALYSNTTASANVANGAFALHNNTTGVRNTANGYQSLYTNALGFSNTAAGYKALFSSTGSENTANGAYVLYFNTTGASNTASGYAALYKNTTGASNTASGYRALYTNTTGDENSAFGYESMFYADHWAYGNTAIGYRALYVNSSGDHNCAIGSRALYNSLGSFNTAIGSSALYANTDGYYNVACGHDALRSNSIGDANTATGYEALDGNSTGDDNTAFGYQALYSTTTGTRNTAVGYQAGYGNGSGDYHTAVGWSAHSLSTNGLNNGSGFGYDADPTAANQVRIGNASVTQIGGQVGWSVLSDATFKTNISDEVVGLDFIRRLRPVTYNYDLDLIDDWKAAKYGERDSSDYPMKYEIESIKFSGFLAQEVESAARDANYDFSGVCAPKHDADVYSLRYGSFVVPLIKAVQEQQEQIEQLRIDNGELRIDNGELRIDNEQLRIDNAQMRIQLARLEEDNALILAQLNKINLVLTANFKNQ